MNAHEPKPHRGTGRTLALLAATALVGLSAGSARADLMKYTYSGTVSGVGSTTGSAMGQAFTGTFSYDPSTQGTGPSTDGTSQHIYGQPGISPTTVANGPGLDVSVGGQSIYNSSAVNLIVTQFDHAGQYGYAPGPLTHIAATNLNINDGASVLVVLDLASPNKSVLPSLAAPAMIHFADFSSATLSVYNFAGGVQSSLLYRGNISSLAQTAPEPSTVILLGVAAAGWIARKKFRRAA